ncbi:ESCRT-II complex subunit VPS36 [Trypanosoma rangeli]|uniref:Vacuolar protein-sorting-associated protein 36 n=1 Tax=Trypanosoma rangeli TaxID=5698 RepID=A0A3R7M0G6_TRYRA|nr:ESCRT-II complex subunit VPS36 [Trypanosoma rangeli]RNF06812.1 ESCRT-II complex subunit VPS36 [Trypanosoma rangeli]|eukprot:RNF06812.1 ESCRT-II complex subunit VPS36 [Trypanosoma rangeli]
MKFWESHAGHGLMKDDEVVLNSQNGVAIYEGENQTRWQDGKLTVTTHHIFFRTLDGETHVLRLPLQTVYNSGKSIYSKARFAFSHAKIIVPLPGQDDVYVKFSFRRGGMEEFFEALQRALHEKHWIPTVPRATATAPSPPSKRAPLLSSTETPAPGSTSAAKGMPAAAMTPANVVTSGLYREGTVEGDEGNIISSTPLLSVTDKAGIAGLMRAFAEKVRPCESLRDIDDVMTKASSLVANIRYLREKQRAGEKTASEDETEIEGIEATLGLGAMVQASSSGSSHGRFHQELALELHAWMTHAKNERVFGSMPLVPLIELFSLYNKARGGSNLVSPGDVLQACRAMTKQQYSRYTFKQLSSGRLALQHKDPSLVLKKLVHALGPRYCNRNDSSFKNIGSEDTVPTTTVFPKSWTSLNFINEVQFAASIQVARSVAEDLLEELEAEGFLCRSGVEMGNIVFHWNIFVF